MAGETKVTCETLRKAAQELLAVSKQIETDTLRDIMQKLKTEADQTWRDAAKDAFDPIERKHEATIQGSVTTLTEFSNLLRTIADDYERTSREAEQKIRQGDR